MTDDRIADNAGSVSTSRSRSAVGRASGTISRWLGRSSSLQATGRFLRRQLWAWPIIAAVLLGGAGWWVNHSIEDAMRRQRAADLNAMVDASVTALRTWTGEQRINVQLFAEDEQLRPALMELLRVAGGSLPRAAIGAGEGSRILARSAETPASAQRLRGIFRGLSQRRRARSRPGSSRRQDVDGLPQGSL